MKLLKLSAAVVIAVLFCVPAFAERAETDILNDTYYRIHRSIYESMPGLKAV